LNIPGEKRSLLPDSSGEQAGKFAEAIRDNDMDVAWDLLSKETRGMRMGVWATKNNINMQEAYQAGYNIDHPKRKDMMNDFRNTVLSLWPLEDLTDLGISPSNYIDDTHCFAFLPFGITADASKIRHKKLMSGLIIPMTYENHGWMVDLHSWRFIY
jgi:hypothetical protein